MKDNYHLDMSKISLDGFKAILKEKELTPSRRMLKEDLEENFTALHALAINDMQDLIQSLKSPSKLREASMKSGLSEEYLKVLLREAKSYKPNPVALNKFPDINPELLEVLAGHRIKNSKHLFDFVQKENSSLDHLGLTESMQEEIKELVSLSDLARLYGVGPVFAKMVYDVGIKSIQDFVKYTAEDLIDIYEKETGKNADFSTGDIEFSRSMAKLLLD